MTTSDERNNSIPGNRRFGVTFYMLAILVVAIFFTYIPSLSNNFINLDDYEYVLTLRSTSLSEIKNLFTGFHEGYQPLSLLSLGVTRHVLGDPSGLNPWFYHAQNLKLHILNAIFVFLLVRAISSSRPTAFLAALIFGLHTIHVESVAWIASRKDLLYTAFYLPALLCYVQYAKRGGKKWIALTFLFGLLSAFSKGMAVSLPLSLLALDYILNRRFSDARLWLEKLPFFALSAAFGFISILAQKEGGYMVDVSQMQPLLNRIFYACFALAHYMFSLFLPVRLSALYPYPSTVEPIHHLSILPVAALGILLIFALRKSNRTLGFGILFFLANIIIALQLLPVADFIAADRYNYISSIGFCLIVASAFIRAAEASRSFKHVIWTLAGVFVVALGLATVVRTAAWKDSATLWSDVIAKHPRAFFAYTMRGCARAEAGSLDNAISDFNRSLKIAPGSARAHLNRGYCFYRQDNMPAAVADYTSAIQLKPSDPLAHNNRALARQATNDLSGALADFDEAVRLGANDSKRFLFLSNRAAVRLQLKDLTGAAEDAAAAIGLNPRCAAAHRTSGIAAAQSGNKAAAEASLNIAVQLDPNDWQAWMELAAIQATAGNTAAAEISKQRAINAGGDKALKAAAQHVSPR